VEKPTFEREKMKSEYTLLKWFISCRKERQREISKTFQTFTLSYAFIRYSSVLNLQPYNSS